MRLRQVMHYTRRKPWNCDREALPAPPFGPPTSARTQRSCARGAGACCSARAQRRSTALVAFVPASVVKTVHAHCTPTRNYAQAVPQVDCFEMEQDRMAVLPADYYKEHMLWWEVWDQMCANAAFDCAQR